jgi:hypothetical protein
MVSLQTGPKSCTAASDKKKPVKKQDLQQATVTALRPLALKPLNCLESIIL